MGSEARKQGSTKAMVQVVSKIRAALAEIDTFAETTLQVPDVSFRSLWKCQYVWGYHGLAMAAEAAGRFEEAAEAFRMCLRLISAAAPSSGYELKYHMMLTQCLSR